MVLDRLANVSPEYKVSAHGQEIEKYQWFIRGAREMLLPPLLKCRRHFGNFVVAGTHLYSCVKVASKIIQYLQLG